MAAALSRSTKPLVVYYCRTYVKCNKAVREGEDAEGEMEDVCYGIPLAAAFVCESDHYALVYACI